MASAYNNMPIQCKDLVLGSKLQGTLDQYGVAAVGTNGDNESAVFLGQIPSSYKVMLRFAETLTNGDMFLSELFSREFNIRKQASSGIQYIFQVLSSALTWTDVNGNTSTFTNSGTQSQLLFSNSYSTVSAGGNSMIASADSTHMSVGNTSQALALNSSSAGVSVSTKFNVTGTLTDKNTSSGTSGQVLSSTGSGVQWISAGTGSVNSVDTKASTSVTVVSGVPLQLTSATLPAGSYLVQYSTELTFAPVARAGIQESFMAVAVSPDGSTYQGTYADSMVRNIVGTQTFYFQSSAVVVLGESGSTYGTLNVSWVGGEGATVTANTKITSTLVGV